MILNRWLVVVLEICAGEEADPLVMICMSTSIRLQKLLVFLQSIPVLLIPSRLCAATWGHLLNLSDQLRRKFSTT